MNVKLIARYIGIALLFNALFMFISLGVSALNGFDSSFSPLLLSALITAMVGCFPLIFVRGQDDVNLREGFAITIFSWILSCIFGMLPYVMWGGEFTLPNAWYESVSGYTTTGGTILRDVEALPKGLLFWRSSTHFIGGMGIILFTLAVIPMLNKQSGLQLFNAEVTGLTHEKIRPRISNTAKTLWTIYIALNIILIILLWAGPMNLFEAICHGMSTIATGGFSTRDSSIAGFNSNYIKIVMTIFMFIAGISFSLIYRVSKGDFKSLIKNDVARWYFFIAIGAAAAITAIEYVQSDEPLSQLVVDIPFQTISDITSSGFNATDINLWHHGSIMIVIALMMIGACAGSTTGGIKIDRLVLIVKNLKNEMYRILFPNAINPVRVTGKVLSNDMTAKVCAFLLLFALSLFVGSLALSLSDINLFDAIFTSMSCLSNNGLGYGFTGQNFADINPFGKWVLSFLMLVGRLEFSAVMILLTKAFWSK